MKIVLDINFNEEWERQLFTKFLAASICDDQSLRNAVSRPLNGAGLIEFSRFINEQISQDTVRWLFDGRLIAFYDSVTWNCWYEPSTHPFSFPLRLDVINWSAFVNGGEEPKGTMIPFIAWQRSRPSQEEQNAIDRFFWGDGVFQGFPNLDVTSLMYRIVRESSGIRLGVRTDPNLLATHEALKQVVGIPLSLGGSNFDVSSLFRILFEKNWIFTENVRRLPLYQFALADVQATNIDLSNTDHLALYLFRLRNGTPQDMQHYSDVQAAFHRLTGRHLKFDVRLADMRTGIRPSNAEKPLELEILIQRDGYEIPLEVSGAGIAEALFLSTLLVGKEGQVVLLDEPALNLHPTMQTTLLRQIQELSRNQFFTVTHSPFLVPPEAITHVSRFYTQQGKTSIARLDPSQIKREHMEALEKELRRSTDVRGMLFSRAVILFEGETELGALPVWFEKRFHYSLESRIIHLYSVGGEQGFETYVRFLQQFAIPWAIVCDGPVIANQGRTGIKNQLAEAGVSHLPNLNSLTFGECCQALMPCGVFTLATNEHQEFENLQIIQNHKQEAHRMYGKSKPRQGRYIAEQYDPPDEVVWFLDSLVEYLKLNHE